MLIAIFSDAGKLADLDALKSKSGLGEEDWEALLQYTGQASLPRTRL